MGLLYATLQAMICFTLRRSMLRSRAIERWLWPAVCSSRTVCSNVGIGCATDGSTRARFGTTSLVVSSGSDSASTW